MELRERTDVALWDLNQPIIGAIPREDKPVSLSAKLRVNEPWQVTCCVISVKDQRQHLWRIQPTLYLLLISVYTSCFGCGDHVDDCSEILKP